MSTTVAAVTSAVTSGNVRRDAPAAPPPKGRVDFQSLHTAFRGVQPRHIEPVNQPEPVYAVRKGDTLSAICASALRAAGANPSRGDIMAASKRVAAANGLANPDLILVGQQLDLTALHPPQATAQGGPAMPPAQWGLAVLTEAVAAAKHQQAGRTQSIVEGATRLSSNFGPRKNPFSGRAEFHSGIDIAAPRGSNVYPVRPGEVTFSGWQPGYGKVVIVTHEDGAQTLYAHNERNLVRRGQHIGWDTPIGRVGSTGDSTGPHVHFELRRNGRPVNPAAFAEGSLKVAQAL